MKKIFAVIMVVVMVFALRKLFYARRELERLSEEENSNETD